MKSSKDAVSTYMSESLRLLRADRERLETLSREIGSLTQNNEHLSKDRENLRKKIIESADEIRSLERELEEFDKAKQNNSNLQTQLETSNTNYDAARRAVKESLVANKIYLDEDKGNRNKIQELMTRLEEAEKQRAGYHALEEKVEELEEKTEELRKQVDENQTESLKDGIEAAYELIENKNQELLNKDNKIRKLILGLIVATGISLVSGYFLGSGCSKSNSEYTTQITNTK